MGIMSRILFCSSTFCMTAYFKGFSAHTAALHCSPRHERPWPWSLSSTDRHLAGFYFLLFQKMLWQTLSFVYLGSYVCELCVSGMTESQGLCVDIWVDPNYYPPGSGDRYAPGSMASRDLKGTQKTTPRGDGLSRASGVTGKGGKQPRPSLSPASSLQGSSSMTQR